MYTGPDPTTETEDGRYIHAYPKVKYPSDVPELATTGTIIVQEKMDGGNFRVLLDNNDRVYGSKKNLRGTNVDNFNVFFRRPAKYIEDRIDEIAQKDIVSEYGPLTLFGENMLRHSLDYEWSSVPAFLVFDIYSHTQNAFLSLGTAQKLADRLNLSYVPVLAELTPDEFHQYRNPNAEHDAEKFTYPIPKSNYRDGIAEGVVFKNYETQSVAKYVSADFKEVKHLSWGFTQKDSETGEGLKKVDYTKFIVAKYVTDTRIEKQLRKLVMEDGELSMRLTRALIDNVYEDIWNEHGHDIIYSGRTVDMGRLHDFVAERCRHRLKAIIDNRDMIVEMEHDDLSDREYLDLMFIGA